jgi:hypothetical protein
MVLSVFAGIATKRGGFPGPTIGTVHLMQIAPDALLDLFQPPLHLGVGEVLVAVVDRLELAAIDRNTRIGEQSHHAAERDEPGAHLADGPAVVFVANAAKFGPLPNLAMTI